MRRTGLGETRLHKFRSNEPPDTQVGKAGYLCKGMCVFDVCVPLVPPRSTTLPRALLRPWRAYVLRQGRARSFYVVRGARGALNDARGRRPAQIAQARDMCAACHFLLGMQDGLG